MNKRSILFVTLLGSAFGTYQQGACSATVAIANNLRQAAPAIEQAWTHELNTNQTLPDKIADILPCYLKFSELLYLKKNGNALLVTIKTILCDTTKTPALDDTLKSIIKKLWLNHLTLFNTLLSHLSSKTRQLLTERQAEIFNAMQTVLQENGLL